MRDLLLAARHEANGAVFREEAGWQVPARYGPVPAEVASVRTRAGLADLGDRAKIEVRGEDRVTFLDGLVTADVKALRTDMSVYALLLTDRSRVVGDLRLVALGDRFVLDIEAGQAGIVLAYMEKFLVSDDVSFVDRGPSDHIELHGPAAPRILSAALGKDLDTLPVGASVSFETGPGAVAFATCLRTYGEPGFAVWTPGATLGPLWDALRAAGAAPVGREALEVLRIEAGIPRVGQDMGGDTLALEVAPAGAISFTKGCYVGQEIVARGTYRGHVNRKLFGLRIEGDDPPDRGDPVRKGEVDVGRVTSAAWSPSLGHAIGLALLRVGEVDREMPILVDRGGTVLPARVHPLPFVRGSA